MEKKRIVDLTNGKIAVITPYNTAVIAEAKRRMGKWGSVNMKSGATPAWILDGAHKDAMQALITELFPPMDALVERVITWTCEGQSSASAPTMDGYDVAGFSRDRNWIKRFDGGEPLQIIEIVNDSLLSYGSRANPRLGGSVTLRLRCRPQAAAGGQGWTVEEVA